MRSINDIKFEITKTWMENPVMAERYGFQVGDSFESHFGVASIENVLFFVMASCVWTMERLIGEHRTEVNEQIDSLTPHRPKWYRNKILEFMADKVLMADTDEYDLEGMSDNEIAAARVVKHAVAVESRDSSLLTIKVAGEENGARAPLSNEHARQLRAYIAEIKDAGVRALLINSHADKFDCEVDIYYNPMLNPERVEEMCRESLKNYIENLPFNGEYTNMALTDSLQNVEGVKIAEIKNSFAQTEEETATAIDARYTPKAGYFQTRHITINMIAYDTQN